MFLESLDPRHLLKLSGQKLTDLFLLIGAGPKTLAEMIRLSNHQRVDPKIYQMNFRPRRRRYSARGVFPIRFRKQLDLREVIDLLAAEGRGLASMEAHLAWCARQKSLEPGYHYVTVWTDAQGRHHPIGTKVSKRRGRGRRLQIYLVGSGGRSVYRPGIRFLTVPLPRALRVKKAPPIPRFRG